MAREVISTGNELSALGAFDAGCMFFGGYPITPSSEVMHEMSDLLPTVGGKFIQMEDEIAGISVALGASMAGTKSMTATSGPGISLKAEQIGLAFIAEVPLVIVNVMRGGPSTGLPTRVSQADIGQAQYPTHGDYASITLCAGSLEECYTQTVRGFNLAERYMTPVFVLLDETVGHMHGKAMLPDLEEVKASIVNRKRYDGKPEDYRPYDVPMNTPAVLNPMFEGYRFHFTGLHHGPTGFPTEDAAQCQFNIERLVGKINTIAAENDGLDDEADYEEFMMEDAEVCMIAYGSISRGAKEAVMKLRNDGIKAGLFRPIVLWPSPAKKLKEIGQKFDKIFVTELNMGQYLKEIERVTGRSDFTTLLKANGRPIAPLEMVAKVKEMF
ncbi:MAG: 2-oxoglutarate synthase subunit alpha [Sulfuricurvum sp. RIFOXYD2_FULL_44_160]|uniref:2-oxoglutarate synthase subunit alpha n=1 Tax=Sulfuricurvum kujiense TaxID=148813 RepID=A0A2D3W9B5_9BACT|nr:MULTISPECIES: 2-oxoglutarate synthase subunit alpha [Sulfuricurvum]OHD98778.1 MAG: 2-oxoglutarate synthase subunit alpha [Sulfuricurvum sp. RIFOXYD2_FULL_44_160]DAB37922.1 MAG TPA: 2-oxoglutarate synthase subunit alpha [Sulfuricurvum kujiense]